MNRPAGQKFFDSPRPPGMGKSAQSAYARKGEGGTSSSSYAKLNEEYISSLIISRPCRNSHGESATVFRGRYPFGAGLFFLPKLLFCTQNPHFVFFTSSPLHYFLLLEVCADYDHDICSLFFIELCGIGDADIIFEVILNEGKCI